MENDEFLTAGGSDWCGAGICFEAASVSKSSPVVADLGQESCSRQFAETEEAGEDCGVGMLLQGCACCVGERVLCLVSGVQLH